MGVETRVGYQHHGGIAAVRLRHEPRLVIVETNSAPETTSPKKR